MAHTLQCTRRLQGRSPRVEPRAEVCLAAGRQLRGMPPAKAPRLPKACGLAVLLRLQVLGGGASWAEGYRPAHKRGAAFV